MYSCLDPMYRDNPIHITHYIEYFRRVKYLGNQMNMNNLYKYSLNVLNLVSLHLGNMNHSYQ